MYEICYEKDKEIKRLERILKRISFDCNINYNRNHVDSEDYSPRTIVSHVVRRIDPDVTREKLFEHRTQ